MGDRTNVEFYIRSLKIPKEFIDESDTHSFERGVTYLEQDEANYGNWDELEEYLKENEIEFDKYWGSGGDYTAGQAYARKTSKGYKYYEIYDEERRILGVLKELSKIKDPKKLMTTIKTRIKELHPFTADDIFRPNSLDFITKK